jgi:hypothetical protein
LGRCRELRLVCRDLKLPPTLIATIFEFQGFALRRQRIELAPLCKLIAVQPKGTLGSGKQVVVHQQAADGDGDQPDRRLQAVVQPGESN